MPSKQHGLSDLDKNLPFSLQGERFILGSLLMGQTRTYDEVMEILSPEDFHKPAHKDIFACMVQLYKEDKKSDILSLSEALKKEKKLEGIGGGALFSRVSRREHISH